MAQYELLALSEPLLFGDPLLAEQFLDGLLPEYGDPRFCHLYLVLCHFELLCNLLGFPHDFILLLVLLDLVNLLLLLLFYGRNDHIVVCRLVDGAILISMDETLFRRLLLRSTHLIWLFVPLRKPHDLALFLARSIKRIHGHRVVA